MRISSTPIEEQASARDTPPAGGGEGDPLPERFRVGEPPSGKVFAGASPKPAGGGANRRGESRSRVREGGSREPTGPARPAAPGNKRTSAGNLRMHRPPPHKRDRPDHPGGRPRRDHA